ncbi:MAG: hypothetical protein AAFU79_16680 [Myxococcota bacterium]
MSDNQNPPLFLPWIGALCLAMGAVIVLAALDRGLLSRGGVPHQFGPAALLVLTGLWLVFRVEPKWRWFYFFASGALTVLMWGVL